MYLLKLQYLIISLILIIDYWIIIFQVEAKYCPIEIDGDVKYYMWVTHSLFLFS